jgi:predicted MPP superfamily phosphohydrolase
VRTVRSHFGRTLTIAIALLCASEALMVCWFSLVVRGHALAPGEWVAVGLALLALNFITFPLVRRRLRAEGMALVFSRGWILGSIGALLAGVLLALSFALVYGAAWGTGRADWADPAIAWLGGAVVALAFGSIAWGASLGQSRVRVDPVALPLRELSPELQDLRIAHITDLHIGPLLGPRRLRGFVEQVNALEPDLIAITGDIFDFDPVYIEEGCQELSKLHAGGGVFAVLGNHDTYTGADRVADGLAELTSIRLLRDEWDSLQIGGARIVMAGVEDPGTGWTERESEHDELARLAAELPPGVPRILLAHRPSWFAQAARLGFDVVLSGHTHGGQVALPMAPNHNPSRLIAHRTRGLYTHDDSSMYVSRGIGVAGLPLRLNCPREIALLRFIHMPA